MSNKPSCLVVDDETDLSELIVITLARMGIAADSAHTVDDAKFMLKRHRYELCLTDMRLPDGNGLDLVRHINQQYPGMPIAVITAFGSADNAVQALKAGAFDYLTKPISLQQLRPLVEAALKLSQQQPAKAPSALIGQSAAILQTNSKIEKMARTQAPVLIYGETGSGKELAARLIHENSSRRDKPFIVARCSTLHEHLADDILFGTISRPGLFQQANGGTLMLDEITDLPLATQTRLLRMVQEKSMTLPGQATEINMDVRLISTSQKNMQSQMEHGHFRQDLFYRLSVMELSMPALRDRVEDIGLLARHFLEKSSRGQLKIDDAAMHVLAAYAFPGNVKELENILERAIALSDNAAISSEDILLPETSKHADISIHASGLALPDFLENIEKQAILDALEKTGQNKTAAAKLLGVSFRTLRYRLSKLGLSRGDED